MEINTSSIIIAIALLSFYLIPSLLLLGLSVLIKKIIERFYPKNIHLFYVTAATCFLIIVGTFLINGKFNVGDIPNELNIIQSMIIENTFKGFLLSIISITPTKVVISSFLTVIVSYIVSRIPINTSKKTRNKKENVQPPIDKNRKESVFVAGTTGSGKTVNILRYIESCLKTNHFELIIDGKGDLTQYSLFDVVKKLAIKYNRKIYIINQSDEMSSDAYNPFKNKNATQVKDLLTGMSIWSEPHYKALCGNYWVQMADFLLKYPNGIATDKGILDTEINFENIIKYSQPKNLQYLVSCAFKNELANGNENVDFTSLLNCIDSSDDEIKKAIARIEEYYIGPSTLIFDGDNSFNLIEAYKENAIVLVVLNKFKYQEFAYSLGNLVLADYKHLLGSDLITPEHKPLSVFDELGVYATDDIWDILARQRSLGGFSVLGTQSLADLVNVSNKFEEQIIANCNQYIVMRVNDNFSAEYLSKIFGTVSQVKFTHQIDFEDGSTNKGSLRDADEFKVHPNEIKELPDLYGYWMTKDPYEIHKFKSEFVKVKEYSNPKIKNDVKKNNNDLDNLIAQNVFGIGASVQEERNDILDDDLTKEYITTYDESHKNTPPQADKTKDKLDITKVVKEDADELKTFEKKIRKEERNKLKGIEEQLAYQDHKVEKLEDHIRKQNELLIKLLEKNNIDYDDSDSEMKINTSSEPSKNLNQKIGITMKKKK